MNYRRSFLFIGLWALSIIPISSAQELSTNLQVFENLGLACLKSIPESADSLALTPPPVMTYLTSSLIQHWQQQGKALFISDSLHTSDTYFSISWEISQATISYSRVNRKTLLRHAKLDLYYTYMGGNGEILSHDFCQQIFSDEIPRGIVAKLESSAHPETQSDLPPDRWIRRYFEPIMMAAVTGLAAFLFFNLRNDSADS